MTDPAPAQSPLAIDRVERARGKGDQVRLRLAGRRLTADDMSALDTLLVIQLQGRRHRFAAGRERHEHGPDGVGERRDAELWEATFTIPDWAVPSQHGQAALWVGNAVVPVPPPGAAPLAEVPTSASPEPAGPGIAPGSSAEPAAPGGPVALDRPEPAGEAGRSGPLADLLFKETVSALHAELEQRTAEAARLRGALADAQSDRSAHAATQSGLETAHAELRQELAQLMAAVAQQRAEFDERLAAARAERDQVRAEAEDELAKARSHAEDAVASARAEADAARSEAATARADLDTLRAELQTARADLDTLRAELQTARADADRATDDVATARRDADAAREQADGARTREQAAREQADAAHREAEAESARGRGEADAQRVALERELEELVTARDRRAEQVAALNQRLAAISASDRRHADEVAALRGHLASAHISRDAATSEAGGLRAELERLGAELAVTREQTGAQGGDLGEAHQLLADARALTEQLRGHAAS